MKRTHRLRLAALALLATTVVVPTSLGHGALAASSVTLRFAYFGGPDTAKLINKILVPFHKDYPTVTVNLEPFPDTRVKAVTQIAAGTSADVFMNGDGDVQWYSAKGALTDLAPYAAADHFSFSQYLPGTLTIGKSGAHQYALPKDYSPLAVYYNKDMFKAAGVALPSNNWTWNEFRADAIKLTKGGVYGAVLPGDWPRAVDAVVQSLGGQLDSPDGKKVVGYMDSAASAKAVQFWIDLFLKDKVSPTPAQASSLSIGDAFASGKAAMNLTGIWPSADYKKTLKFGWAVAPLPHGANQKHVNTICYAGFTMAHTTRHPQQAWELIKYLSGPVGDSVWVTNGLPSIKSVADKAGVTRDPVSSVFLKEAGFVNLPEDINGPAAAQGVGDTLHEALQLLLNNSSGGVSVAQVLKIEAKKGQKQIDAYYAQ